MIILRITRRICFISRSMNRKRIKKAYAFVLITAFLFATMEVSCKIGAVSLDPFQLTCVRFIIGGLLLLPFALAHIRKHDIHITAKDHLALLSVGVLGVTISMSLFQLAIVLCNASTVAVLFCSNPFFTMAFAHFLTSEKLNRRKAVVLFFALLGIISMIRPWDVQQGNSALGLALIILAALIFGLYTIAGKLSQEKMGLMAQTSFSFLYGAAVLLLLLMITGRPVVDGLADNVWIVIYTGIFVTGIGYYCYFKAIELADAATGSFAFFIKPVIAPIIAMIVLKETILWNSVLGIILILIASTINLFPALKNRIRKNHGDNNEQIKEQ